MPAGVAFTTPSVHTLVHLGGPDAMPLTTLLVNGGTTIIGLVMLCIMAYGTQRYGFFALFEKRLGRVVMVLGWVDLAGLVCWS